MAIADVVSDDGEYDTDDDSTITWTADYGNGYAYTFDLLNVHWHITSEHTAATNSFAIEAHFVHFDQAASDAGNSRPYAVAGYWFEISADADRDPFIDFVLEVEEG